MKKCLRPPVPISMNKPALSMPARFDSVRDLAFDFKKSIAPKSIDLSFMLRIRN